MKVLEDQVTVAFSDGDADILLTCRLVEGKGGEKNRVVSEMELPETVLLVDVDKLVDGIGKAQVALTELTAQARKEFGID